MRFFPPVLAISLLFQTLSSQDYLWPTNSSHQLSSTFGEYRVNHLHAGIDIKTNGRTGYPVYAISDGYIQTIRASYSGFGKVIYQRLDDGNIAVYGHLDDFADPLLGSIRAEQERQQRYRVEVNLAPNEIRVAKGQIIGYTGDSGTLFPHLHFELRDSLENPVNPLNTNLTVFDKTAPTISAIAVTPVSREARVNGLPSTQTFRATHIKNNHYIAGDQIRVTGQIGIELKTYDTVKGVPNVYPPHGIKLFVDDSLRFQVQYDKFSYEQTRYSEIDRNYQLDHELGEVFNRLWVLAPHKTMPMNVIPGATGIFNLSPGPHAVHIVVYDKNQNISTIDFKIHSVTGMPAEIQNIHPVSGGYRVALTRPGGLILQNIKATWVTRQGDYKRPANCGPIDSTDDNYQFTIFDQPGPNEFIKVEASTADGYQIFPLFGRVNRLDDPESIKLNYRFLHNPKSFLMYLTFSDVPDAEPSFYLQTSRGLHLIRLIRTSPVEFVTVPIPFSTWQKAFACEVRTNTVPTTIHRQHINLNCIAPDSGKIITSQDSLFTAVFPADAVYDSLLAWLSNTKPEKIDGGKFESSIYALRPTNQPLHDSLRVYIKYPMRSADDMQIGVYLREDKKWRFIGNQTDPQSDFISAPTRRLGEFALIRDVSPPIIRNIYPGNGGKFRASDVHRLKATVLDELSGIRNDLAIVIRLDDYPVIAEYHAPKHYIKHELAGRLNSGQHTLTINVIDRAGNTSIKTSTFTILPG